MSATRPHRPGEAPIPKLSNPLERGGPSHRSGRRRAPRRPAAARATSRDVARAAGVSQAAVSLVLGDKWRGRVSPGKAEAVRAAARELGYRPNLAARSLRMGRTRTVLLVVPALTTEFFARVYTGAARVAADHGSASSSTPPPKASAPPVTRSTPPRPPWTA